MGTFQPPPPLLPDLVSQSGIPPPPVSNGAAVQAPQNDQTSMISCFQQKQQVTNSSHEGNNFQEADSPHMHTMLPSDDSVVRMMMDCSMSATDCSSGIQSNSISNWPSATPSSSSSTTTFNEYPPHQQQCLLPPPPSPPQIHAPRHTISQPPQLPDIVPSKVVEEFEKIMSNENDKVVLTNSVCLLFRFSIDSAEVCQLMSASPDIMNRLYYVLRTEQFEGDDLILCYATGNLTNISKYDEGRAAILGCIGGQIINQYLYQPSFGVESLIRSLQSRDSNVVIFAITAIHNLLLDRRVELQDLAKRQIKHGLRYIVQLLDNQCLIHNYEFKVIVLDCLQILAYGNEENRLAIKEGGGPFLLLRTIRENFHNQPTEELIETASRVLKSLSACPDNKVDIIENRGIDILTDCIKRNNQEILKTCLWTLRNLSDVINKSESDNLYCIDQLVERLLHILDEYADEPCIITCALGILANLTCNNEGIKQFICEYKGVDLLLKTMANALRDGRDFRIIDKEIFEPAVCALCHLMNQTHNPKLANDAKESVRENFDMFKTIMDPSRRISEELSKAFEKLLTQLAFKSI